MKLLLSALALLVLLSCVREEKPLVAPVNPDASPEAGRLLNYLYDLSGEQLISGQHNYPWSVSRSTDTVIAWTGKAPALWGGELGVTGTSEKFGNFRLHVINSAKKMYEQGNIITLMCHFSQPWVEGDREAGINPVRQPVTDEEWQEIVTDGTEKNRMLIAEFDSLAVYIKRLTDANIPVLWRPFHEMNGAWFWWGDKKGPDGFQKLWKIMYDRFVNHHKLNNLLWVWNANAPRDWKDDEAYAYHHYYPGHEYVDILAADIYKNDYKKSHHDDLLKLADGKIIAIGECGVVPSPEVIEEQPEWTWFMTWAQWIWRENTPDSVRALYNDPKVMTLDEHIEAYKQLKTGE